jgi:hypothetical protein
MNDVCGIVGHRCCGDELPRFVSLHDPITGDFPDPTFRGIGRLQISPRNARGSFACSVKSFLEPGPPQFLALPRDDQR